MAVTTSTPIYTRRRFNVDEYHAMAAAGILHEDDRIELIEGELVEIVALGGRHIRVVTLLSKLLMPAVGDDAFVSAQGSIRLNRRSEPEPDFVVLRRLPEGDAPPLAADVLLLFEVSDTTFRYDRDIKVPLYARAGIPRVLIFDLKGARLWNYSSPQGDRYQHIDHVERGDQVSLELSESIKITIGLEQLLS